MFTFRWLKFKISLFYFLYPSLLSFNLSEFIQRFPFFTATTALFMLNTLNNFMSFGFGSSASLYVFWHYIEF